jgi:hypothetical protein
MAIEEARKIRDTVSAGGEAAAIAPRAAASARADAKGAS